MLEEYDYIIVGAGPAGFTLAWLLAKKNLKILILEKSYIGGCHSASSENPEEFYEHGPRVYSSSYLNFKTILHDLDLKWEDIFTPYNFTISKIGSKSISHINMREMIILGFAFVFYPRESVMKIMQKWNFRNSTRDYIDRICRLTDGAGADNYTVYKFGSLLDQEIFYKLHQPRDFMSKFWKFWKNKLVEKNVEFQTCNVKTINRYENYWKISNSGRDYIAPRVVFAIPPQELIKIQGIPNIENARNYWENYAEKTSYIKYHSYSFYWKKPKKLENWGFCNTRNGLVYIVLSDYYPISGLLISAALTKTNFTDNPKEVIKSELLETLKLPEPDFINRGKDMPSWIHAPNSEFLDFNLGSGLYTLGSHNGKVSRPFTTLENAVSNSMVLANDLEKIQTPIKIPLRISKIIMFMILVLVILIVLNYKNPVNLSTY